MPCEDIVRYNDGGDIVAAALADGATCCCHSLTGAQCAAEAVLDAEKKIDRRKRRTKAALQADKPSAEMTTEAVAAVVEKQAEKAKRGRRKVKAAVETAVAKAMPAIVIQSPLGGEITPEEIIAKTGPADKIYVRIDQNKAYWVRGEETGDVDLW